MSTNINGFDELIDSLKSLEKNVHNLEGTHTISFDKLFTKIFMEKHTDCSSFDEFLKAGNFVVDSQEDFEAIPDDVWDHIRHCYLLSSFLTCSMNGQFFLRPLMCCTIGSLGSSVHVR